ncbi:hypothetical protein BB561_001783 [Smittium simulii]|uniref:UBX domain-containing protein n=1 Tax=Smittium simulii TaxID=133385 RepID=A0A2T9YT46_9FUNG|nr:hypothetical protein BB561_001783 [Smittium simulii]
MAHSLQAPIENRRIKKDFSKTPLQQKPDYFESLEEYEHYISAKKSTTSAQKDIQNSAKPRTIVSTRSKKTPTRQARNAVSSPKSRKKLTYKSDTAENSVVAYNKNICDKFFTLEDDFFDKNSSDIIITKSKEKTGPAKAWSYHKNSKIKCLTLTKNKSQDTNEKLKSPENYTNSPLQDLTSNPALLDDLISSSIQANEKSNSQNNAHQNNAQSSIKSSTLFNSPIDPSVILDLLSLGVKEAMKIQASTNSFNLRLSPGKKSNLEQSSYPVFFGNGSKLKSDTGSVSSESSLLNTPVNSSQEAAFVYQVATSSTKVEIIKKDISKNSDSLTITHVQVKLFDGSKLLLKANQKNTIADIISAINDANLSIPDGKNYVLKTQYPSVVLNDHTKSIIDLNLLNSVLYDAAPELVTVNTKFNPDSAFKTADEIKKTPKKKIRIEDTEAEAPPVVVVDDKLRAELLAKTSEKNDNSLLELVNPSKRKNLAREQETRRSVPERVIFKKPTKGFTNSHKDNFSAVSNPKLNSDTNQTEISVQELDKQQEKQKFSKKKLLKSAKKSQALLSFSENN